MTTKVFSIIIYLQFVSGWVTYEGTKNAQCTINGHGRSRGTKEETMKNFNISKPVFIENYGDVNKKPEYKLGTVPSGDVTFDDFMTTGEIEAYIISLSHKYPHNAIIEDLGRSFEGRNMFAIRITTGPLNSSKPTISIDAGIHARKWIAPATALYVIQQLVENSLNAKLYRDIDWVILPVLNPDGYSYSRTVDSFWRKTRSKTVNPFCRGVDVNRNFDYFWMEIAGSDILCTPFYAGPQPNSESEIQALVGYLQKHKGEIKLYITLNSFGEYLLYPWGYTTDPVSNNDELHDLGTAVAHAIPSYSGTTYTVGSSAKAMSPISRISLDYAIGAAGVDLSYTIELPTGNGTSGFHPLKSDILPIVQESWEGLRT